MIFCYAERRLGLVLVGAVPSEGLETVLGGGVNKTRTEGDLTGLDIFLITLLLLHWPELGHVAGETLSLRPLSIMNDSIQEVEGSPDITVKFWSPLNNLHDIFPHQTLLA